MEHHLANHEFILTADYQSGSYRVCESALGWVENIPIFFSSLARGRTECLCSLWELSEVIGLALTYMVWTEVMYDPLGKLEDPR